ncbi:MAG: RloB domain-containing protein [Clavibacter sp.]|nr:RloB domain-containing protein [Clavibacter sp.]
MIALFCEGEATEPEYFKALAALPEIRSRAKLDMRISLTGAVPLTLVESAVAARARDEASEYWCVFDVEWPRQHPHLHEAFELARTRSIRLAVSNPCFEIWLILHMSEHGSHLDNDDARRRRRDLDGAGDKHVDAAAYLPLRAVAAGRARALELRHERESSLMPHNNPSTSVYQLVESIERASGA